MWIWSIILGASAELATKPAIENSVAVETKPVITIDQAIEEILQPTLKKGLPTK